MCPFWLVQGSSDAKSDLINMELTEDLSDYERKGRSKQIKIPFLRNTRPIKGGETLVVFRKKEERPTVPEPIVKIEDDDEDDDEKKGADAKKGAADKKRGADPNKAAVVKKQRV